MLLWDTVCYVARPGRAIIRDYGAPQIRLCFALAEGAFGTYLQRLRAGAVEQPLELVRRGGG